MPVLVTGAETGLGRVVITRLLRTGGEVRAYLDPETSSGAVVRGYQRAGLKIARGATDDEARLEVALASVHTVIHAGGGPLEDPATLLDALASVVSAALGAGCRRLVWASHLGADLDASNAYLRACAEAEALLAETPLETVVVRRALTYGPDDVLTAVLAAGVPGARLRARHAPLYLDDLAGVLLAADAERGRSGPDHLVVDMAGPEVIPLERLISGLRAILPGAPPATAPPHLVDVLSRDLLPGSETLGRTGTPLAKGLSRIAA